MPRRKDVELRLDDLITEYGQQIKMGDPVLFVGREKKKMKILSGIYSGKYVLKNELVSVRIENVKELNDRRPYSILPLNRVFRLHNK